MKQLAQELAIAPTAAEAALNVLSSNRVKTRRQLSLLATCPPQWSALAVDPPTLKQALFTAATTGATAKRKRRVWPWLVLPLVLGGMTVLAWRTKGLKLKLPAIRFEIAKR